MFWLLSSWVKIHQICHVIFETTSQFSIKFWITLPYLEKQLLQTFFCWNFTWFGLSTVHVKFHQICTLIGSFSWKYIKFQLKKYRGVMSHYIMSHYIAKSKEKLIFCFTNEKTFGEFWSKHAKFSKILLWLVSFVQSI